MERNERVYLMDMLNAAQQIKKITQGMDEAAFIKSEIHQLAVLHLIQIIGEAARHVTEDMKHAHPEIEWQKIIGMRNILVHRYFRVEESVIWGVVSTDLDDLIAKLVPLIPPDES